MATLTAVIGSRFVAALLAMTNARLAMTNARLAMTHSFIQFLDKDQP